MKLIKTPTYEGPDRRNGKSWQIVWWLLGLMTLLVVTGGSGWLTKMQRDVVEINAQVTSTTARVSSLERSIGYVDARLDRIEEKLDRLLEQRRTP